MTNAFCVNYQANMLNITAVVSTVTKCEVDVTGLLINSTTIICLSKIVGATFQQNKGKVARPSINQLSHTLGLKL